MANTINSSYIDQIIKEDYFRVPLIVRECEKNADRHNAENMNLFLVLDQELGQLPWIAVATDADPFEDIDSIIEAMKFNSGLTGTQGCGHPASGLLACGRPFNHRNFGIITYSKNSLGVEHIVFCEAEPIDSNTNSYRMKTQERLDLIPLFQKIIGDFKFKNNKDVSVLHLFKWGDEENPISKSTLASFREFCPNTNINIQWCIRKNQVVNSTNNMQIILKEDTTKIDLEGIPVEDHVHNRVCSGATVGLYESLYSLNKHSYSDMPVNFECSIDGYKYSCSSIVDFSAVLFPGITGEGKSGQVSLRSVESGPHGGKRKAGSKGGHEIVDSGNRIFVSFQNDNNKTDERKDRPGIDPVYVVNDKCPYNPSTYSLQAMNVSMKSRHGFYDVEKFLQNCKDKNISNIDYDAINLSGSVERHPYLKIYLKIKNSDMVCLSNNINSTLLKEVGMTNCFYASKPYLLKQFIKASLETFGKSEYYDVFKQYYDILFPKSEEDGLWTFPIDEILQNKSFKESKGKFVVRIPNENDILTDVKKKIVTRRRKKQ